MKHFFSWPQTGHLLLLGCACLAPQIQTLAGPVHDVHPMGEAIYHEARSEPDELPGELQLFAEMPMVITAARKPQQINQAPSTINVITEQEIKSSGATKLSELLERLPGIYTPTAHNALDMLWIRGVGRQYNDNALLLIDGAPYRTLYVSNFPLNEQLPLEDIKRIEVIRGPGSALYGSNAFTGVINIITKHAEDIENGEVTSELSSWDGQNHSLLIGKTAENFQVSLFARYLTGEGYESGLDDEGLSSDESREPKNETLNIKFTQGDFNFSARLSRFEINDFTAVEGDDEGGVTEREHLLVRAAFKRQLSSKMGWQLNAYYNQFKLDKLRIVSDEQADEDEEAFISNTEIYGSIAGLELLTTRYVSPSQTFLMGISFEAEELDHAFVDTRPTLNDPVEFIEWASASGGDQPESIGNNNYAVFLEDEIKFDDYLVLTTGLRYDDIKASTARLTPRISAIYNFDPLRSIKFRYGEAFRAPTYQELFRKADDGEGDGSRDLEAQTIKTFEVEYFSLLDGSHWFNITAFHTRFEDFIAVIGDGNFENLNAREFYGLETSLKGKMSHDMSYFLNHSFTQGRQGDDDIAGIPSHLGNVGLVYTGIKKLEIAPYLRLVGKRNRPANYQIDVAQADRDNLLANYDVVDVTIRSQHLHPVVTELTIKNVFDERYFTSGEKTEDYDVRQPQRSVAFSLQYEW